MVTYRNYIDGKWVVSDSGEHFKSINPANPAQTLGWFQKSTKDDVKSAVEAAQKGYEKWSEVPAPHRAQVLFKATNLLKGNKEYLAKLVSIEMGKVIAEARGDVQEAIDVFEYMAGEGRRLFGYTTPSELHDKFCMTIRRPVGVVGLITPWNFPLAIPAWKLAPALICGNGIVFKPASDTPLCATKLIELLEKAGVSGGVVNMVTGTGESVGDEIIRNGAIKGISFTGSREVGEHVMKTAGIKKIGLELGGKNAIIVMDDANLDLALEGVIWGGFGTTGQRCTAASRVIVQSKVKKKFEHMLLARIKKLKLGPGIKPTTDIGPLINQRAVEKTQKYVHIGVEEGAKLLCGGKIPKMHGFYHEPTFFTDVDPYMKIAQEEIFGPFVSLIEAKDLDDAIEKCNSVTYGLSSSIYTRDIRKAFIAMQKIEAGLTYVNSSTIGSEVHLPFGGVKGTGNGTREAGIEGIHEFSETKTLYVDYSNKLQKAQIDSVKVKE